MARLGFSTCSLGPNEQISTFGGPVAVSTLEVPV
jgi:hypothetical protein